MRSDKVIKVVGRFGVPSSPAPVGSPGNEMFLRYEITNASCRRISSVLSAVFINEGMRLVESHSGGRSRGTITISLGSPSLLRLRSLSFSSVLNCIPERGGTTLTDVVSVK